MGTMAVCQTYFDAWNNRDAQALSDVFAADGTYGDPSAGEIAGSAVAGYADGLWQAFPDLHFDLVGVAQTGEDTVAAEWLMLGTNQGPFRGLPPTGKSVTVPGADFIQVSGGKIKSVKGYFDSRAVPEQLGLQVVVQPHTAGPFAFGNSVSVRSGRTTRPGAFSITKLEVRDADEIEHVRQYSRQVATEMLGMEGFIGFVGSTVGSAMMTITAWEQPEQVAQVMQDPAHREAVAKFYGRDLAAEGWTSVWTPHHINPLMIRCDACGTMARLADDQTSCSCGAKLREPKPYW